MAGTKKVNLNQNRNLKTLLVAVVVVMFGGLGVYLMQTSQAATNKVTTLYGFNDYRNLITQPYGSPGVTVVEDKINLVGANGNLEKVMQVEGKGIIHFGGNGGPVPNAPVLKSGETCYILRPVKPAPATVTITSGTNTSMVNLKAPPNNEFASHFWQRICLKVGDKGNYPGYSLQNNTDYPVNVYRVELLQNYKY